MQKNSDNNNLLDTLKQLYRKLNARILHRRLNTYHSYTPASGTHNTLEPLKQHISKLSDKPTASDQLNDSPSPDVQAIEKNKSSFPFGKRVVKGLSTYFRRKRPSTTTQPLLAKKMCDATRQHITLALNHARRGDVENAHMQLDLANNALHMAEHYMSEEAYQQFHHELESRLVDLDEELKQSP